MNFQKYLGNIFVNPPYCMTPIRTYNVTPSVRSAENIRFGGYFIEQNFP